LKLDNKKILFIVLLVFTVLLGIGAVYIGITLSKTPTVTPTDTKAYTYGQCPVLTSSLGSCQMPDGTCTGPICMKGVKFDLNNSASCDPGQMVNCLAGGPICASSDCGPCLPTCGSDEESVSPVGNDCPSGSRKTFGSCQGCDNPYWGCCRSKVVTTPPTSLRCGDLGCTNDNQCEGGISNGFECDEKSDPTKNQCVRLTCPPGQILNPDTPDPCDCKPIVVAKYKCGDYGCTDDSQCEGGISSGFECDEKADPTKNRCIRLTCPSGEILDPSTENPCDCKKINVPITPKIITGTPIVTDTPIVTGTPKTALVSDEADRIIIGVVMIFIGIVFYNSNWYLNLYTNIKTSYLNIKRSKQKAVFEEEVESEYTE